MMTIEEIITKYDKKIRSVIGRRCDNDVLEDLYQDCIMVIMNKLDVINQHPNPVGYIITIAKRCARPSKKANKKLLTYGGWTNDDDEDTTEEWLLEDDSFSPERILNSRQELKQRKRSEDFYVVTKKDFNDPTAHIGSYWRTKKIVNRLQNAKFYGCLPQTKQYKISGELLEQLQKRIKIRSRGPKKLLFTFWNPKNIKQPIRIFNYEIKTPQHRIHAYLNFLKTKENNNEESK